MFQIISIRLTAQVHQEWVRIYDNGFEDDSRGMAVDNFGNVTNDDIGNIYITGSSSCQMTTFKYDPTLVNEEHKSVNYNYQFSTVKYQLSSGIYYYELKVNDFCETRNILLLK